MPSLQRQLYVSIAGWTESALAGGDLKLDCTSGDEGPTRLFNKLGQDWQGWVGLQKWLGLSREDRSEHHQFQLVGMDRVLLDKNGEVIEKINKCIKATQSGVNASRQSKDTWVIVMSLKRYLELKRRLSQNDYEKERSWFAGWEPCQAPSLVSDSNAKNESATRWQLQWAGFHPDALDFVRKNQRVLPDEVPLDYRKLEPGVIRRLTDRGSPTIFDRIWDDLDDVSQRAIIKVIRDQLEQAPPELALLKDFGFYQVDGKGKMRWFSPLFEAYVYYYKTLHGILQRVVKTGKFFDGILDLLDKISSWRLDYLVARSIIALIVLWVFSFGALNMPSFWWSLLISFVGILLAGAASWPSFKQPRQVFGSWGRILTNLVLVVAIAVFLLRALPSHVRTFSTVNQDQIGLALSVVQVAALLPLTLKIVVYLSDFIGKILPPGK